MVPRQLPSPGGSSSEVWAQVGEHALQAVPGDDGSSANYPMSSSTKPFPLFFSASVSLVTHSLGITKEPSSTPAVRSIGFCPSTVQPTALHVPRTSFTVPQNSFAWLFGRICRQTLKNWSLVRFPLCWMFFTFFRSRSGSFSSLMTRDVAFGTTSTLAARFWIVSRTVTRIPFQALVAFTMSSPTFFGDMPRGPTFGASTEEGACSPPYCRRQTYFTSFGSNFGAMATTKKDQQPANSSPTKVRALVCPATHRHTIPVTHNGLSQ